MPAPDPVTAPIAPITDVRRRAALVSLLAETQQRLGLPLAFDAPVLERLDTILVAAQSSNRGESVHAPMDLVRPRREDLGEAEGAGVTESLLRSEKTALGIPFGQKTHLTAFSCGVLMIITQEPAQSLAALDAPLSIEVTVPRK
jgi:hypothetical protein